ncbi:MAG: membrane protein insertase YidC [Bacteroidales bacterium]|jgi:YidC/Oxa1 family membrane protein insertase|nr:membrane protein insertase YidC [Bacteroidales bacterium]
MDKKSIIGIVIIGVILLFFYKINQPSEEQIQKAKIRRDSLEQVNKKLIENNKQLEEKNTQERVSDVNKSQNKNSSEDLKGLYGDFANAADDTLKFITLENDLIKLKISNKGGRLYSAELKNFNTYQEKPLILFDGDSTVFGFKFFAENKKIITNDLFFISDREEKNIVVTNDSETISMRLFAGDDKYIEYTYTLAPESYMVDLDINLVGMNDIISNRSVLDLDWQMYSRQQEKGFQNENMYTSISYKYYQDEVNNIRSRANDEDSEELNNKIKWIDFKQQFFSVILMSDNYFTNSKVNFKSLEESENHIKFFNAEIGIPIDRNDNKSSIPLSLYLGPNNYKTLKSYGHDFEQVVPLGWTIFGWVNKYAVIPIFDFLGKFIASYGLIILVLTILIKLVLFPLTYKSYLSTAKMRVLKPQIDEIGKKFPKKEDAMKKQQATMALYKKVGVSPLGGCLPMLVQMPILFAMFRFFPSSFQLRQESFLWADDLSSFDSILDLPFEIPFYGDHVSLFTLLMAVALVFTSRLNSSQMNTSNQQMPGMKFMMTYMMPVMLLFVFNNYSAGLSYYYFLSNVFTLGQTLFIRRFVDDEALLKKLHENKKKPQKKSKLQARLEEAAKKKGNKK